MSCRFPKARTRQRAHMQLAASLASVFAAGACTLGSLDDAASCRVVACAANDAGAESGPAADAQAQDVASPEEPDANTDASAPIAFVQANAVKATTATVTLPFQAPTRPGTTFVVAFSADGLPTLESITDALGSTYAIAIGPYNAGNTTYVIAAAPNAGQGANSVTVKLAVAPVPAIELYIHEFTGLVATNLVDATSGAVGTARGTDQADSGSATTTSPNELIFGFGTSGVMGPGTAFMPLSRFDSNVTESMVVHTVGSYAATGSPSSNWVMLLATFRGP